MEKSNSNKVNMVVIVLLVLIIVGLTFFVGYKLHWFGNENNVNDNVLNNTVVTGTISGDDSNDKEELSDKVKKIEISGEELLNILLDTAPFDDGTKLPTQQYLEIVYNALNENYISAYKGRREEGKDTAEYTVEEINGIVYSLFGVTMPNNESLGSALVYKDKKYILQFSDRGTSIPMAKNVENDIAAGSIYTTYDLYYKGDGEDQLEGNYTIRKSSVTTFVRSKIKN